MTGATLFDFEAKLADLMDELEDLCPPEGQVPTARQLARKGELESMIAAMLAREGEKVDAVYSIIKRLGRYCSDLETERNEINARLRKFEGDRTRLAAYVLSVMDTWGAKKLEGKRGTLTRVRNPASVEVTDAKALPPEFQRWEFRFSPRTVAEVAACKELLASVKGEGDLMPDKAALRSTLQEMEEQLDKAMLEGQAVDTPTINGVARLKPGDWRLQVRP